MTNQIKIIEVESDGKGCYYCDVPITKEKWLEILRDETITTPDRMRVLLSFYFMPEHKGSCVQLNEKYGYHYNVYNTGITAYGRDIVNKLGSFKVMEDGEEHFWYIPIGKGCYIYPKGNKQFEWQLRKELVEAIRNLIIEDALEQYVVDFDKYWPNEKYKWHAVQWFQDKWNIEAPNFAEMLENALSKTLNLLASQNAFPRSMLIQFAQVAPEEVRKMFIGLFDENKDLAKRVQDFMEMSEVIRSKYDDGTWNRHYQNTNVVSTYLWLRFPNKYYIYKYSEYIAVANNLGLDYYIKRNGQVSEMIKGFQMYDELNKYIHNQPKLSDIIKSHVVNDDKLYNDTQLRTATIDFGFWVSRWFESKENSLYANTDNNITPTLSEEPEVYKTTFNHNDNVLSRKYWWLVASPDMWKFTDIEVGEIIEYTLYNKNGNKRRIFQNFLDAKAGDLVIGYASTPTLQIVALGEIAKDTDDKHLYFRKSEQLLNPIDYSVIRSYEELQNMECMAGGGRGALFKLTEEEYQFLLELIRENNPSTTESLPKYTDKEFLDEVYMSPEDLQRLKTLLQNKKNIILQGAPGVGKTFTAERLAYTLLGVKDEQRVEVVQFHQNYSYEDFILGYKPSGDGFELKPGVFYKFCKKASNTPEKDFFFIIDEVNRGNLSKIFGELLMLIENSYRGKAIKLAYNDELFVVPKNLYIIGMMNTADRSLAMIDYALRRRFSFFEMSPGFPTDGFKKYQSSLASEKLDKVIEGIQRLNEVIINDDSLGQGFCIGHSYFCNQERVSQSWLESVVEYDIAPMLREYWFDDNQKYETQINVLRELLK